MYLLLHVLHATAWNQIIWSHVDVITYPHPGENACLSYRLAVQRVVLSTPDMNHRLSPLML